MKFVIIGRTGTGKTTLAKELQKQGLKVLKTCTTRKPRNAEDANQYHFLTQEEADNIPAERKALRTTAPGYEYFALKEELQDMDVCILDPDGYREIVELFPETLFCIVHAVAEDSNMQRKKAVERMADRNEGERIFEKRVQAEDTAFSKFEREMAEGKYLKDYVVFVNDYDMEHLKNFCEYLTELRKELEKN